MKVDFVSYGYVLGLLTTCAYHIPDRINGPDYYKAMLVATHLWSCKPSFDVQKVTSAVCALLASSSDKSLEDHQGRGTPLDKSAVSAYKGFAWSFLTSPAVSTCLDIESISRMGSINYQMLTAAVAAGLPNLSQRITLISSEQALWLLAHYIFFGHKLFRRADTEPAASHVEVMSRLLSHCASDIEERLQASRPTASADDFPLSPFVEQQLLSLVDQDSFIRLMDYLEGSTGNRASKTSREASSLATYVLTLLRIFPRKADDIRMRLFWGGRRQHSDTEKMPAVKFFYDSVRSSAVFKSISREPREVCIVSISA